MPTPIGFYRPKSVGQFFRDVMLLLKKFFCFIVDPVIPYDSSPGSAEMELPKITEKIPSEQLAQCQAMFDQCEARRDRLEKKAQWVFTVLAFLVPVLVSLSTYLIRDSITESRLLAIAYLIITFCLLILSFVSAARAMAVRPGQYPFIQSVIDEESGDWKIYDRIEHARSLLRCAMMNTRTNDHIAQFVKGAHCLMVISMLLFVLAVIAEIGFRLHERPSSSPTVRSEDSRALIALPPEFRDGQEVHERRSTGTRGEVGGP